MAKWGALADKSLLADFFKFAEAQIAACDIDPLYPVLEHVFQEWYGGQENESELTLWACLVYVAYYNAASALTVLHELPPFEAPDGPPLSRLPTGIERRGLRGGRNLVAHLQALQMAPEIYGSYEAWLQEQWIEGMTPRERWQATRDQLLRIHHNGRWATYKMAEVLQKVAGWPIEAPDMGMDGATGPLQGLEMLFPKKMLFGNKPTVLERESQGRWLWRNARKRGLDLDLAEVETCLCDFHGLCINRYFVGHDVALLYDDVHALEDGFAKQSLLAAAEAVLPSVYWRRLDPRLRRVYTRTGSIDRLDV